MGNKAIIGPRKFPGSNFFNRPVPNIQEKGGSVYRYFGFVYQYYPERSFMYSTTKRLAREGKIARRFSVTLRSNW